MASTWGGTTRRVASLGRLGGGLVLVCGPGGEDAQAVVGGGADFGGPDDPYGIRTTIVEPGFFRTELLVDASTSWAELSIDDYAERTRTTKAMWQSMNGQQAGDPSKLADALLKVTDLDIPPLRFVAGDDAIPTAEAKGAEITAQATASRTLGTGLAHADAA